MPVAAFTSRLQDPVECARRNTGVACGLGGPTAPQYAAQPMQDVWRLGAGRLRRTRRSRNACPGLRTSDLVTRSGQRQCQYLGMP